MPEAEEDTAKCEDLRNIGHLCSQKCGLCLNEEPCDLH